MWQPASQMARKDARLLVVTSPQAVPGVDVWPMDDVNMMHLTSEI